MQEIIFINICSQPISEIRQYEGKTGEEILSQISAAIPIQPSLGIISMIGYIEKSNEKIGIDVIDFQKELAVKAKEGFFVNSDFEGFINEVLSGISQKKIDYVGVSCLFNSCKSFVQILGKKLRDRFPEAKLLIGGGYGTTSYPEIFSNTEYDMVILGEGERPFSNLLKKHSPEKIKGVITREQFENGVYDVETDNLENLDDIPFTGWKKFSDDLYFEEQIRTRVLSDKKTRNISIMTSRGCPLKCTFCASHAIHERKFRYLSAPRIIEEIVYLKEFYGVNTILVDDDNFSLKEDRVMDVCDYILDKNLGIELQFPNGLYIHSLNERIAKKLNSLGVKY